MLKEDIVYMVLMFLAALSAPLVRTLSDPYTRKVLSTLIGYIIVLTVSGYHIIHPLIVTFINAIIVLYFNRRICHIASAVFCFSYLAFFRSTHYFGLPIPPGHTNAIQMILTLKMVGLAFEIKESDQADATDEKNSLMHKYRKIKIGFCDVFNYAFCFAGVLIGPYYKYRTYSDMFDLQFSQCCNATRFLFKRLKVVPLYIVLYLIGNFLYPLEFAASSEVMNHSFLYRIFYMTPSFFNFRMRIYAGFVLGECVCIGLGLGVYPEVSKPQPGAGPTDYAALDNIEKDQHLSSHEYSFETVKNIYEYGSEFWPTIREGIRSWNRTVQYWLVSFVYKKVPGPKQVKTVVTMFISAFWHGIHPGYYLCLCSAPIFLFAEAEVEKAVKNFGSYPQQVLFDWVWWIIKMQSFAYMGMAFLLLDIQSCLYYWKSIYFCGHVFIVIMFFIAYYINHRKVKKT